MVIFRHFLIRRYIYNHNNLTSSILWEEKNSIGPLTNCESKNELETTDTILSTEKKLEKETLKDIMTKKEKISGIYKIINKTNGKYYVGSSNNIYKRWREHKYLLNKNAHANEYIQRSWNKYGADTFDFLIVERNIQEKDLLITEQKYLDQAETKKENCYNLSYIAGKIKMTSEIRRKISESQKGEKNHNFGKHPSQETRRKLIECRKGKNNWNYGGKHSEETKRKIGEKSKLRIDKTIYKLFNTASNEIFEGTTHDFTKKYNILYVRCLLKGRRKSYKNWILTN
jgi:group I intron endonuclease